MMMTKYELLRTYGYIYLVMQQQQHEGQYGVADALRTQQVGKQCSVAGVYSAIQADVAGVILKQCDDGRSKHEAYTALLDQFPTQKDSVSQLPDENHNDYTYYSLEHKQCQGKLLGSVCVYQPAKKPSDELPAGRKIAFLVVQKEFQNSGNRKLGLGTKFLELLDEQFKGESTYLEPATPGLSTYYKNRGYELHMLSEGSSFMEAAPAEYKQFKERFAVKQFKEDERLVSAAVKLARECLDSSGNQTELHTKVRGIEQRAKPDSTTIAKTREGVEWHLDEWWKVYRIYSEAKTYYNGVENEGRREASAAGFQHLLPHKSNVGKYFSVQQIGGLGDWFKKFSHAGITDSTCAPLGLVTRVLLLADTTFLGKIEAKFGSRHLLVPETQWSYPLYIKNQPQRSLLTKRPVFDNEETENQKKEQDPSCQRRREAKRQSKPEKTAAQQEKPQPQKKPSPKKPQQQKAPQQSQTKSQKNPQKNVPRAVARPKSEAASGKRRSPKLEVEQADLDKQFAGFPNWLRELEWSGWNGCLRKTQDKCKTLRSQRTIVANMAALEGRLERGKLALSGAEAVGLAEHKFPVYSDADVSKAVREFAKENRPQGTNLKDYELWVRHQSDNRAALYLKDQVTGDEEVPKWSLVLAVVRGRCSQRLITSSVLKPMQNSRLEKVDGANNYDDELKPIKVSKLSYGEQKWQPLYCYTGIKGAIMLESHDVVTVKQGSLKWKKGNDEGIVSTNAEEPFLIKVVDGRSTSTFRRDGGDFLNVDMQSKTKNSWAAPSFNKISWDDTPTTSHGK